MKNADPLRKVLVYSVAALLLLSASSLSFQRVSAASYSDAGATEEGEKPSETQWTYGSLSGPIDSTGMADLAPLLKQSGTGIHYDTQTHTLYGSNGSLTFKLRHNVQAFELGGKVVKLTGAPVLDALSWRIRAEDVPIVLHPLCETNSEGKALGLRKGWTKGNINLRPPYVKQASDTAQLYFLTQVWDDVKLLKNAYPALVKTEIIGYSDDWNPITEMTLGTGDKNPVYIIAVIHGREYHGAKYVMYEAYEMAKAWEEDQNYFGKDMRAFFNHHTLHIIPVMNPDGMNISQYGYSASRTASSLLSVMPKPIDYRTWKGDGKGINPNRNFDFRFYEPSKMPLVLGLGNTGKRPEESSVVRIVSERLRKMPFLATLQIHEKGKIIYWSDVTTEPMIAGNEWFGGEMSRITGYGLMPSTSNVDLMQGGLENWIRHAFRKPSICLELGTPTGPVPNPESIFMADIFNENRGLLADFADTAARWNASYGVQNLSGSNGERR